MKAEYDRKYEKIEEEGTESAALAYLNDVRIDEAESNQLFLPSA